MSEPDDELTPLPDNPEEKSRLTRSPFVSLGVAALVVSTVFATVAALASTRDEQAAPAPQSEDKVETTTAETYTTDPTATSAPDDPSKKKPVKRDDSSTASSTTEDDETTTEDEETTTGGGQTTTTPGQTTTRPPTTQPPPANKAPVAGFDFTCTNLACDFDGANSSDPDGSIASYSWSFGASGQTASHTFEQAGTFDVTLTVTDNKGKTDTETRPVTVATPSTTSRN